MKRRSTHRTKRDFPWLARLTAALKTTAKNTPPETNGLVMEITFDISEDELPIFLAELDEHLQVLDDILIRLEREESDAELVQTVFRSAHTIKGMCGMIGHRRMTDLTHALETVLDGVRKNSIQISTPLVDQCLEAVDRLRSLREEVVTAQVSDVDINGVVQALKGFSEGNPTTAPTPAPAPQVETRLEEPAPQENQAGGLFCVEAKIDTGSMASAARAFQLMMALQGLGDILEMAPSQEQIEASSAVAEFKASVSTGETLESVSRALMQISGVDEISINGKKVLFGGAPLGESPKPALAPQAEPIPSPEPIPNPQPKESAPQAASRRAAENGGRRVTDLTVRTNVERLDSLMNLVGELITDRNHLLQIRSHMAHEKRQNGSFERLSETITHLGRITDQLQEEVMRIRMLPVGSVFSKFPRMVRDLAQKFGKQIDVVIRGEETEMDRSMIDEINDPLIHLIRNSVDHGIETPEERLSAGKPERGTLTLTARHEQGRILLTVEDDGRGIDGAKLRKSAVAKGLITPEEAAALTDEQSVDLMFMAGLSTAQKVTDVSGRGVGLDIVNTNIQHVNGVIQVETKLGQGTCFQIVLPLTLAIVPSLLVRVRESTFAIPLVMVTEILRLNKSDVQYVYRKPVTMLRGNVLSLVQLADIFKMRLDEGKKKYQFAVVVHSGKQRVGLIVDSLVGEEEVVVKPLGAFIGDIPGVSSAAILGDGQVALIVDVFGLFKLAGI